MTDASDETTISDIDYDNYDVDGLLLDLQKEVGQEVPPPVDSTFSERVTADVTLSYRDPDAVDYHRQPYLLELSGHLWSFEVPISQQDAEDLIQRLGDGWHEEIGLDLTVEEAAELGVDVDDYEVDDDD